MNTSGFHPWRSIGSVLAGFIFIGITHNGTDQILHATGVYPPLGEPMTDSGQFALALSYRIVFAIAGCYITAWLAPRNPMRHALVLGGIGVALGSLGFFLLGDDAPKWYPLALVLVTLPCAWVGAKLYLMRASVSQMIAQ